MRLSELIELLNQSQALISRCESANTILSDAKTALLALGQGMVRREITLNDNPELSSIHSWLDTLITNSPIDGTLNDTLLLQLAEARSALEVESNDPELPSAMQLAFDRNASAKALYEQAHLACEAFTEIEAFSNQLMEMNPTAEELSFLTQFRWETDRFRLVANYLQITLDNFVTVTWQLYDWATILLNDPRNKIELFNDNLPFALLPVRLETRFMTIKHVRDNLAFGSANEVFRTEDGTATAHDVKKASILLGESFPIHGGDLEAAPAPEIVPDTYELWVRIYPDDIAIHTHEDLLTQQEIAAGQTYWNEMWRVGTSTAQPARNNAELGAWRTLCSACGAKRAAWVAKQTTPTNNAARPSAASTAPTALSPLPTFPTLTAKPSTWSQQPHTKVMPDRFVVRVYNNSSTYREVLGSLVPNPLPVGLDPSNPAYSNYLNQSGSGLNMPPELRWLTEFEEAEKVGMGIRIPLQGNEKNVGFERLLVLGIKQNLTAAAGSQLLEELFDNHHYSSGLAILPQGTATNNTPDKKSGYESIQPGQEDSFAIERLGNLFPTTTDHYLKADGQRLAEALGVNTSLFQHVANSNFYDVKESMAMSKALWSATLGYYMKNLLTPSIVPADITNTRSFFTNYVHGRGLIPAFRVRNQPYGVLPATVYSRWAYSDPYSYEAKLHRKVLDPLRLFWKNNLVSQVKHVNPPYPTPAANPDDLIVNILGLHPASLEFHQRVSVGRFLGTNMVNFMLSIGMPYQWLSTFNFAGLETQLNNYLKGTSVGLSYSAIPRILGMGFSSSARLLNGPVIDTLALSEKRTIQKIPNSTPALNMNYIGWLQQSPLSKIRNEDFTNIGAPAGQAPPQALLYLLLRHAWFLEYLEASHCMLTNAQAISVDAWFNQEFIKLTGEGNGAEYITEEQKELLYGVVKSEVNYEYGLGIEETMRHLNTNEEYLTSGMTPEQFEAFIRDRAIPFIEEDTNIRYGERLAVYSTEQSQWNYLTNSFEGVTNGQSMEEYLFNDLSGSANPCITQLKEVSDTLGILKTLPTARLERCLAEHLDTCAYRLDSWLNGLVSKRMNEQRQATPGGVYVGAYGILEKPHPGPFRGIHVVNLSASPGTSSWSRAMNRLGVDSVLSISPPGGPLVLPQSNLVTSISAGKQQSTFIYLGTDTSTRLIEDPDSGEVVTEQRENSANGGFILAPSLNHAVTAAILRAGYKAHSNTGSAAEAMSVTLTSARVRTALYYLEGIKNGQMLSALLGYRFERGLHDWQSSNTTTVLPLDIYLLELRDRYPLLASAGVGSNNNAQANLVVDGLRLLQVFNTGTAAAWAAGIPGLASGSGQNGTHYAAVVSIIEKIKDDMDAIGDLLLAESVYQVSRGNNVRAGSVLNAIGRGETIPEPEIIKTPRKSDTLTHRCVVQLQPAVSAIGAWSTSTRRAIVEPAFNNWLASQLPAPVDVLIHVNYSTRTGTAPSYVYTPTDANITLNDLGVQPIDLLHIFSVPGADQQDDSSELSRRVIYYVQQNLATHDDKPVIIDYKSRWSMATSQRNVFEMMPQLKSLIQIAGKSRAAEPEDFMVPGLAESIVAANPTGGSLDTSGILSRLTTAIGRQASPTINSGLFRLKNDLIAAIATANGQSYTSNDLMSLRQLMMRAANYGVEGAIPEMGVSSVISVRDSLVKQAGLVLTEVGRRQTAAELRIFGTLPADPKEKFKELTEIAQIVFGRSFRVFPDITLYNATDFTTNAPVWQSQLMNEAGPYAVEEWMYGVSRVRPRMGEYHKQMLLSECITGRTLTTQSVVQFPVVDQTAGGDDRWAAMKLPAGYKLPSDVLSLVVETDGVSTGTISCGMVIDEWPEQIPIDNVTAGIAVHYDQPSSEAPQSILMATTPVIKSKWLWNDLMDTLNETMDMAMIRAVEPDMIETSGLAQVLPALVMQMSGGTATSPSLDFAKNIIVSPPGMDNPVDLLIFPQNPLNLNNLQP